ncbi:MAG: biopolymer transporter ExbD [Sneathiella sp.]
MITLDGTDSNEPEISSIPDLTSLLDILFILLVFFILSAGASYRSLDLTLPNSVSETTNSPPPQKHIMLEIRAKGYAIDGQLVANLEQLKPDLLKALDAKPDHKLVVAGDKSISIERLLNVLTFLQLKGIKAANILMQQETK